MSRGQQKQRAAIVKARKRAAGAAKSCACGKVGFPSEHAATDVLLTGRSGHRVYLCEHGMWHTTSRRRGAES